MSVRPRAVVLGGGFAGLETAFTLRQQLGDRIEVDLVSDQADFLFKPNTIYLPFGGREDRLHIPLRRPLRRRDISLTAGKVAGVDTDRRRVEIAGGAGLPYDFLVIATGAAMAPEEIPGLGEFGQTIWTPGQMHRLGQALRWVVNYARMGREQRVLFVVPPNNKCAGPLYEIVFMLETWLRRKGVRHQVEITFTTYENSYIQAFGPRLHEVVTAEFATRGIHGHTGAVVTEVHETHAKYADGSSHQFDQLIAFPPYVASVAYEGLPADERGFLRTELATRRVLGHPDVYAPGDAGDFPVKQAFLAFLQADAVADHIAGRVQPRLAGRKRRFEPVSMCVMEMFDKATFAQVPLELTGDAAKPIRVRPDADDMYKVGVSPIWRLGKKALGIYLPLQFAAGRPFHGGKAWAAMELALNGMSRTLAR